MNFIEEVLSISIQINNPSLIPTFSLVPNSVV